MNNEMIGQSKEDYLEAILMTIHEKGDCRVTDVANLLHYSKPSVSVAVKKLEEEGYVMRHGTHISLTESGTVIAERMLKRHTLLSTWLKSIGIEEAVADDEACEMEHIFSDDSFERIADFIKERS